MHTVYPCGYSVHAGQIEALMERAHTLLIDLRKTPWSTMSAWRRPMLAERYEERYGWFGETLGNLNYNTTGPILLANLAWNLKNQGKMAEARALYEESMAADPAILQTVLGFARLEEAVAGAGS